MKGDSPDSPAQRGADTRPARLTVDTQAIAANWRFFSALSPSAETAAVVKACGYGLGAERVASALAQAGARVFFVATAQEGVALRAHLGAGPIIYVLNGTTPHDVGALAAAGLAPVLNSLAQIALWAGRGACAAHLDTGMNRLGIGPEDWNAAAAALAGAPLDLVMSHLACSASPRDPHNARQLALFRQAAALFPAGARRSIAASAGALIGPDYHFDMIRVGLGLYGSAGLDPGHEAPLLAAAARIEAPILQVREVEAGASFGYGATAIAARRTRIATVAIGYADGCLRSLSGRGYGVVGGGKRPILGRVSMDLTILDVTDCAAAVPGAMAEFLGAQAPLDEVAALAGTIPYEVLTTFAGTVRRGGETA